MGIRQDVLGRALAGIVGAALLLIGLCLATGGCLAAEELQRSWYEGECACVICFEEAASGDCDLERELSFPVSNCLPAGEDPARAAGILEGHCAHLAAGLVEQYPSAACDLEPVNDDPGPERYFEAVPELAELCSD